MTSSNPRPSGPLCVAIARFREHQRVLAAADRAERYMLAAVAQLAADGTVEERAEYVRQTQQILDEFDTAKPVKKLSKPEGQQGVLVTADSRGRITLPFGRPNWRYQVVTYDDGSMLLTPVGPRED